MDKIKTKIAAYMLSAGIVLVGCENKIIDIIIDDKSNDFSNDTSTSQATEVTNPIIATEVTETLDYLIESPDFSETESTIEMPKATIPEMTVPETTIPETTAPEETEEPTLPPPTSEMFIATADTTIYAGDSSKSLKIGSLEINDKVIKLLSSDNWTLVKQNDTIGYVRNADLDPTGEEVEIESELTLKMI